jgi:hypothetical protein
MLTYLEAPGNFRFSSGPHPGKDQHRRAHQNHHHQYRHTPLHFSQLAAHSGQSNEEYATSPGPEKQNPSLELIRKRPPEQLLERRSHTKSRRGCYNCKRRRIKCQETHPACGHCVKTGLKCEFPSMPQITHQPRHLIPLFSLEDMRFFQHFVTKCYPHQPLGQEAVWTHEIPCLAGNHEYLMHAILGLAASSLELTDGSLVTAAVAHRVKAIKAIRKRLANTSRASINFEEANALVAACFALAFQSISLEDGLAEYMTFIRGIVVVGMQMAFRGIKPLFTNLFDDERENILEPHMEGLPLIQRDWADAAFESLSGLKLLCVRQVETEYHERLVEIVEKLYINSFEAYKANAIQHRWWMMLPQSTFQELINPNSQIIMLLHAHAITLTQIMNFINRQEYKAPGQRQPDEPRGHMDPGFMRWAKFLNSGIDYEHQIYNKWPMWVEDQLDKDGTFFSCLGGGG